MVFAPMKVRRVTEVDIPELGSRIYKERKKLQDTQSITMTTIAERAGMSAANWYRIEAGDVKVLPVETLRKIEEVLGVDFGVNI